MENHWTPEEIKLLQDWVGAGAEYSEHWAYVAPESVEPPEPAHPDWCRNWIDKYILARLERESLSPAEDADAVTLIRRLYFDLTGLPPTPDEVDAYVNDQSDANWERIVDQLLNSDAYAERMTMYWLDLVRFADTVGYHGDQDHSISPYRDWVIDAFAENMPFDQFTREQLAGDLLPDPTTDQKVATGYNRLLQTSHEGGVQPREYLAIYSADRVRNLSAVWLAATVGCAQCHDHKYDPWRAADFYSFVSFFSDIDEAQHFRVGSNALPTRRPPELKVHSRREREELRELEAALADVEQQLQDRSADSGLLEQKQKLEFAIEDLKAAARLTMITVATDPREIRFLPRGNWLDDSGAVMQPQVPEFLNRPLQKSGTRATRLDLANWICDREHGIGDLTARVFTNRFWYLLFGRGLAEDLDDFGGQGAPPDHPELLDRLSIEFLDNGWDVRSMLRLMVCSRTYRQSSAWTDELRLRDPGNSLFARQSSFRLPAETIRDGALDISGLLVQKVGGPSVKPYQPAGYYRHLNFPQRKYSSHDDERQWRRGLYVHWQRQFLHPMLKAFDAPTREECTSQRSRSNTPLAALTLLNDPTFTEAARAFAERLMTEKGGDSDGVRLSYGMRLAVGREPDATEAKLLRELLIDARKRFGADADAAASLVQTGLSKAGEGLPVEELAAWTIVARALLNLDEAITRN